jgi:hypothetical protein
MPPSGQPKAPPPVYNPTDSHAAIREASKVRNGNQRDARLRVHGFTIHSRPAQGRPTWQRRNPDSGVLHQYTDAEAEAFAEQAEARSRAELIAKGK